MSTTALPDFFVLFSAFLFWGFLLCPILGGLFYKEWEKTKMNTKQPTKKQDHKNQDANQKTTEFCLQKRKQTTQTQNNATSLFRLQTDNTRNKKTRTKALNIKTNYLLANFKKHQNCCRENNVFHRLKAKQEKDKNIKKKNKQENYQKRNQHRNRKAETYTMKTQTKTTEEKNNQPKTKATWVKKRGC